MGIREHLGKHEEGDLKLQDLEMEHSGTKEIMFDPDKEISDDDWQAMSGVLAEYKEKKDWGNFFRVARYMKFLGRRDFSLALSESEIESIKHNVNNLWPTAFEAVQSRFEKARSLEELEVSIEMQRGAEVKLEDIMLDIMYAFPDLREEIGLSDQRLEQVLENKRKALAEENFVSDAAMFVSVVDPKGFEDLDFDQDKLFSVLEEHIEKELSYDDDGVITAHTLLAALEKLRMIFLQRKSKFFQDERIWNIFRKRLEYLRKKDDGKEWYMISKYAFCMTLMSVEKVEMTKNGLKLTQRSEEFKQEKKSRPERRKF